MKWLMKCRKCSVGWCLLAAVLLSPIAYADTLNVAEDAYIDLGNPNDNVGTVPSLEVSDVTDRHTGQRLTFLSFDLLELPDGASLDQAWLRVFVNQVGEAGDLDLYLVLEPWDEHGISASTAPALEALPFATVSVAAADAGHFVVIDVTPEVQDWLDGGTGAYGFALAANPGTGLDLRLDSKENPQTSHHSELELVLGVAPGGIDSSDIADDSITSDDIADDSITSDDIADDSITSDDIKDDSITSDDIKDGSIGSADVDKDQVQLRVSGTCLAGSSIREIDNLGGVTCEPDDDSGGDITSVFPSAGGGLAGGAASGDAELGIAEGGVVSSMIADGTIVAADIDKDSVQRRVSVACGQGSAIRAISSMGSVECEVDDDTDTTLDPDLFWKVGGNAGTNPIPAGPHFLGTTDDTELALGVNGMQALRLAYESDAVYESVNVLGGHSVNRVTAIGGTVAGGGALETQSGNTHPNKVEGRFGAIGGGWDNGVLDEFGFIGGGDGNVIGPSLGVFGYNKNSVIAGGHDNAIEMDPADTGDFAGDSFIGGGYLNRIVGAGYSAIAGGAGNEIHTIERSFIGGGESNKICDPDTFPDIGIAVDYDAVLGGRNNQSCGGYAAIAGGFHNLASGRWSVVIGGEFNEALGIGSLAAGSYSKASGFNSFALGSGANADHTGAFVWSDAGADGSYTVHSERVNQFRVRAHGGARFDVGDDEGSYVGGEQWVDIRTQANNSFANPADFRLIDTSTGAYLSLGGGWVNASDRNRKTDIREVDTRWVLDQLAAMPVQTWRYKVEDQSIRHIGPMAQDFQAYFGFGGDPRGIMSVDADGVALAAIQALYQVTRELEERTAQLEAQNTRLDSLETRLQALEAGLHPFEDQRLVQADIGPGQR